MRFQFAIISEQDILNSAGGIEMLDAISYDGPLDQLVTGRPGSGKTTVSIMRARRLFVEKKPILFLTKHKLLVYSLQNAYPGVNIYGLYRWFKDKTGDNLSAYQNGSKLREKITDDKYIYDEVLVDEGQDLPAYIFEALPHKGRRFLVGADTAQRIVENGATAAVIERTLEEQGRSIRPVELQFNYRNFVEVYDFARQFVPEMDVAQSEVILQNTTKGRGGAERLPRIIQVSDKFAQLSNILEDNNAVNIAIVLPKQSDVIIYYNELSHRGFECSAYYNGMPSHQEQAVMRNMQSILITTYVSVKGLEFPVVIMPEMERARSDSDWQKGSHYYVGCTRATERLYLLYQGNNLPSCIAAFRKESYRHQLVAETKNQPRLPQPQPATTEDLPF
ncbi:3'-5' exonuclease [Solirubrum puertoriconensis]|uniref:DNA 3'-5' helicase II n=1 Tax=Solirubrum puertoriconensis TaxID=1751427 RepID=A0A9X0L5Y8_SOLP1|nr:3'-5' exonuclease [Solirubrum puertoriconensis]KUG09111.1 hypothetical protein ASU33_20035 [Solirubrum puertoriconensis]